jgi:hypothetical protein
MSSTDNDPNDGAGQLVTADQRLSTANDGRSSPITIRRVVMWCEMAFGGLLGLIGAASLAEGQLLGHLDEHHGGAYQILIGSFLFIAAASFGFAALCLRGSSRAGWLPQLLPLAILGWVFWDVLSHPG